MRVGRSVRTIVAVVGTAMAGLGVALAIENGVGRVPVDAQVTAPPVAVAVERSLPADPAQIQLSFAPVARRAAPAVVNVYSARVNRNRPTMMDDPFFASFSAAGSRRSPASNSRSDRASSSRRTDWW